MCKDEDLLAPVLLEYPLELGVLGLVLAVSEVDDLEVEVVPPQCGGLDGAGDAEVLPNLVLLPLVERGREA